MPRLLLSSPVCRFVSVISVGADVADHRRRKRRNVTGKVLQDTGDRIAACDGAKVVFVQPREFDDVADGQRPLKSEGRLRCNGGSLRRRCVVDQADSIQLLLAARVVPPKCGDRASPRWENSFESIEMQLV